MTIPVIELVQMQQPQGDDRSGKTVKLSRPYITLYSNGGSDHWKCLHEAHLSPSCTIAILDLSKIEIERRQQE